jgi:hypothetical protein
MPCCLVACAAGGTMTDVIIVDEVEYKDLTLDAVGEWSK